MEETTTAAPLHPSPTVAATLRGLAGRGETGFSVEVLPPPKGKSLRATISNLDQLMALGPRFVNITTHHSEPVYETQPDGSQRKLFVRKRPGTVAVAAAIHQRYGVPVVPHLICQGFSREETEYVLIDLNFLGLRDLFLLRGDVGKETLVPPGESHRHATDLIAQVNDFNAGRLLGGQTMEVPEQPFSYGVAGYPEKHAEAPDESEDLRWLQRKVQMGAEYIITQLFYDNDKFYRFRDRARAAGIEVPLLPGLKPLSRKAQLDILPRVFATALPRPLVARVEDASDDDEVRRIGAEWLTEQALDLRRHAVPCVHFYTLGAVPSVCLAAAELLGK